MNLPLRIVLLVCLGLLACGGCSKAKSTDDLIADLKSRQSRDRVIAIRLLPERKKDAEKVVPAMIEALRDRDDDVRLSAAVGLGGFGEQAQAAVPGLEVAQRDSDARVRRAAGMALSRIDPARARSCRNPAAAQVNCRSLAQRRRVRPRRGARTAGKRSARAGRRRQKVMLIGRAARLRFTPARKTL